MARRPKQSFENYYGPYGAILRDYKPYHRYDPVIDAETKQPKVDASGRAITTKTDIKLGMTVVAVSPFLGFEHISVKIEGDTGTLEHPDIDESFDTADYIYVEFDDFVGGQYTMDGKTHYTGTAKAVFLADEPFGNVKK